ncbi:hypothetical protein [Ottowia thiooxydans]|uniref:hypothetical protein n=1 Tax=Ottowia thiooxydans TaxID=219182 RepID=UPI000492218F|nr:hypothetical protein [Ottowia thiooxydans]
MARQGQVALAVSLLAFAGSAQAQGRPGTSSGIYACVDANGKRLSSDRPIATCIDREQRELNSSGTTRRVVGPSLSVNEREAREQRDREAGLARHRAQEAVRHDRALLSRYPDKSTHDASRNEALTLTQSVIDAANRRITELAHERTTLDEEMEFYRKDPSRAPSQLRRRMEGNSQSVVQQQQAIAGQNAERTRINARFDEELARLQQLWQAQPGNRQ